jgi:hypothetical protein
MKSTSVAIMPVAQYSNDLPPVKMTAQQLDDSLEKDSFTDVTLEGTSLSKDSFGALESLIPKLQGKKLNSLSITPSSLDASQLEKLTALAKQHKITAFIYCQTPSKDQDEKLVSNQNALHNVVAINRREAKKRVRLGQSPLEQKDKKLEVKARTLVSDVVKRASEKARPADLVIQMQEDQDEQEEQQEQVEQQVEVQAEKVASFAGTISFDGLVSRDQFTNEEGDYQQLLLNAGAKGEKSLAQLWGDVAGRSPEKMFAQQIKYLDPAAAKEITKYWHCFSGGLNLNNLPNGFFLQVSPSGDSVLCFDENNSRPSTDFTLRLRPISTDSDWPGDTRQFNEEESDSFQTLWEKSDVNAIRSRFKRYMKQDDAVRSAELNAFMDTASLEEMKAVWPIFYNEGCVGIQAVLAQLAHLEHEFGAAYFAQFKQHFLRVMPPDWSCVLDPAFKNAASELMLLGSNELIWWKTLTAQQNANNPQLHKWVNFAEQLSAFKHFCKEYKELTRRIELPPICSLQGVENLQLALDNLLVILKGARDRNEQADHLLDLDLTSNAAAYAVMNDEYYRVTSDMKLSPQHKSIPLDEMAKQKEDEKSDKHAKDAKHSKKVDAVASVAASIVVHSPSVAPNRGLTYRINHYDFLQQAASDKNSSYDDVEALFYRYLGRERLITAYDNYRPVLNELKTDGWTDENRKLFLAILAFSTTGERGCKSDLQTNLRFFINAANQSGNKNAFLSNVFNQLVHWNSCEPPPTLRELVLNVQTFVELKTDDAKAAKEHFAHLRKRIDDYGKPWLQALEIRTKNPTQTSFAKFDDTFQREFVSIDGIDPTIMGKLSIFLATTNMNVKVEELKGYYSKLEERVGGSLALLLPMVLQGLADRTNGATVLALHRLLDILATINMERVPADGSTLPIINHILTLFQELQRRVDGDSSLAGIFALVQQVLPQCSFNLSQHTLSDKPVALNQEQQEGLDNLTAHFSKEKLAEFSEALCDPERVDVIIKGLEEAERDPEVSMPAAMFRVVARVFLSKQVDEAIKNTVKNELKLDLNNPQAKETEKLVMDFIRSRIGSFMSGDLKPMLLARGKDLKQAVEFIDGMKETQARFPAEAKNILTTLSASPTLILCDMSTLANILKMFARHFPGQRFPRSMFNLLFIEHPDIVGSRINNAEKWTDLNSGITHLFQDARLSPKQKETCLHILISVVAVGLRVPKVVLLRSLMFCAGTYPIAFEKLSVLLKQICIPGKKPDIEKSLMLTRKIFTFLSTLDPSLHAQTVNHFFTNISKKPDRYNTVVEALFALVPDTKQDASAKHDVELKSQNPSHRARLALFQILAVLGPVTGIENLLRDLAAFNDIVLLEKVARLCQSPTPLSFDQLKTALHVGDKNQFNVFLDEFEQNPFGLRDASPFETSQVERVLRSMVHLSDQESTDISYARQNQLNRWVHIVNAMGHSRLQPIFYREDTEAKTSTPCAAMHLSRQEMMRLVAQYRAIVQDPAASPHEKLRARLAFLALAREAIYRTTDMSVNSEPLLANSTQLLAVLNAMSTGGNSLSQIPTGQGKTLITALFASMRWLEGPVDVCTSNIRLSEQGFHEYKAFFSYLGPIKTSLIYANSDLKEYQTDGINFSDISNMTLFSARQQLASDHKPLKKSGIIDESDHPNYDDESDYRYAAAIDRVGNATESAYKEIYGCINEFLEAKDEYVDSLREYLLRQPRLTALQKEHLSKRVIDDDALTKWFNSAITARFLKDPEDFTVRQEKRMVDGEEKLVSVARVFDHSRGMISPSAQWSHGVHQCLQARLQKEQEVKGLKHPDFLIESEISPLSVASSVNALSLYDCAWEMTGTPGSKAERAERLSKQHISMTGIPPHQPNHRIDRDPIVAMNKEDQEKKLLDEIKRHLRQSSRFFWRRDGKPQPMLIICHDTKTADAIHKFIEDELKKDATAQHLCKGVQLHHATKTQAQGEGDLKIGETDEEKEKHVTARAGQPGWITVSTKLLGRGTNIRPRLEDKKTPHPEGLFVMPLDVQSQRDYEQAIGRAGRQGEAGESLAILNAEELVPESKEDKSPLDRVERTRQRMEEAQALRRANREAQRNVTYYFQQLFNQLIRTLPVSDPSLKRQCMKKWAICIENMDREWKRLQSVTDLDLLARTKAFIGFCHAEWGGLLNHFASNFMQAGFNVPGSLQPDQRSVEHQMLSRPRREPEHLSYAGSLSPPLVKVNLEKLYHDFMPPMLSAKPEPVTRWQATVGNVLAELKAYNQRMFMASTRRSDIGGLIKQVEAMEAETAPSKDTYEKLLKTLNSASSKAMIDDFTHDENAFFKRNSRGSRYQEALSEARRSILTFGEGRMTHQLIKEEMKGIRDLVGMLRARLMQSPAGYEKLLARVQMAHANIACSDSLESQIDEAQHLLSDLTHKKTFSTYGLDKRNHAIWNVYEWLVGRCSQMGSLITEAKDLISDRPSVVPVREMQEDSVGPGPVDDKHGVRVSARNDHGGEPAVPGLEGDPGERKGHIPPLARRN